MINVHSEYKVQVLIDGSQYWREKSLEMNRECPSQELSEPYHVDGGITAIYSVASPNNNFIYGVAGQRSLYQEMLDDGVFE